MNKAYKIIFNKNTGRKEVVSELAKNNNGLIKQVTIGALMTSFLFASALAQVTSGEYYDITSGVKITINDKPWDPLSKENDVKENFLDMNVLVPNAPGNVREFVIQNGKLTIKNQAMLTIKGDRSDYPAVRLGNEGVLEVNNSTLNTEGFLMIGGVYVGSGAGIKNSALYITNGGVVNATANNYVIVSRDKSTNITLSIEGANSQFNVDSRDFFIGEFSNSTGQVIVKDGGQLNVKSKFIELGRANSNVNLIIGANEGQAAAAPGTISTLKSITNNKGVVDIGKPATIIFKDGEAALIFNHTNNNYVFNNIIQSANNVNANSSVKVLAGKTIFIQDHTYTNQTIIDQTGTLQLGQNSSNSGSIAGNINLKSLPSQLIFDRNNGYEYSKVISGIGKVTHANAGRLIFTGNNTYTGETLVNTGVLQVGKGGTSGAIVGNVNVAAAGSAIEFNRSDSAVYAGAVTGLGKLIHSGQGKLTLTGNSTNTAGA